MPTEEAVEQFRSLFDDGYPIARALACRIVGDLSLADDLAAEAFTRGWARWRWLRRQPSPLGWLIRVTRNLSIDAVRRKRPDEALRVRATDMESWVDDRMWLEEALDALPQQQRAAVALRYLRDMTELDVAKSLGVSQGTVKTHLHRGLARLRAGADREADRHEVTNDEQRL